MFRPFAMLSGTHNSLLAALFTPYNGQCLHLVYFEFLVWYIGCNAAYTSVLKC
jgi:hypothetical protein